MTQVEIIQAEIESLSKEDFARLREWLLERDWQLWDDHVESDAAAGKLQFVHAEAKTAKARGELLDL
jgi:hypothetical protein